MRKTTNHQALFLPRSQTPRLLRNNMSSTQAMVKSATCSAHNMLIPKPQLEEAHLLNLPKELLSYIIELVVVKKSGYIWCGVKDERSSGTELRTRPSSPAPARTCSLLEATVLPIYYGQNRFAFRSPGDAADWLLLKVGRKDGLIVRRIMILQVHKREAALEVSFSDKTGVSVTPRRNDGLMQSPAALVERISTWVEKINDTSKQPRRREDMIRDFCFCLSLYLGLDLSQEAGRVTCCR